MAESTLESRLREHAEAFDGLLSLIPAKDYYGKDTSDQWSKKKQTKQQAAAAKRAKLHPDSEKSAKDVMDESARKRKLDNADSSSVEGVEKETPLQGMKKPQEKKAKRQKTQIIPEATKSSPKVAEEEVQPSAAASVIKKAKHEKSLLQKQRRLNKDKKREEKKLEKINKNPLDGTANGISTKTLENSVTLKPAQTSHPPEIVEKEDLSENEIDHLDAEGLVDGPKPEQDSTSPSPIPPSPIFDNPAQSSTSTSTSSVIPPANAPKHIKVPTDPELLRTRLAARIEALRAARKADGPDGAPPRNRQELMESRRKKEEQRKAHKKELRLKAKAEEDERREAAIVSARDSPASSLMSPAIASPEHNFSFGRVTFADGQNLAGDLSTLLNAPKKRGPRDPASELAASERKRLRIAGLDEEKRADIEEKDLWLNARKRAHGEKVRDDTSLLKKTLKRKEKAKKKSEKEWGERKDGVNKVRVLKQEKRERNLQKRIDEKGSKGKGKKKVGGNKGKKTKSRPGFEGSFGSGGKRN